jgi:phospholipid transport system substrate-binding protein
MTPLLRRSALLSLLALLAAPFAHADLPGDVQAPIETLDQGLLAVMKAGASTSFAKRFDMLGPIIDQTFDLSAILQTSVGLGWSQIPQELRDELLSVFREFTVASYVANFDSYGGEQFRILPNLRAVGARKVVATEIVSPNAKPIRLDYVMQQAGSSWKAVDVLMDGTISRVAVQRSDFGSLFAAGGARRLIQSLQEKVGQLSNGALG